MENFQYVILGGGNASGYAAKEIVTKKGSESAGKVCIISDEPYVSYERPALSKGYLFPEKPARLPGFHTCVGGGGERQDTQWYTSKGIAFKTNSRVTSADISKKILKLKDGNIVTYDKLIIATGARPVELTQFGTANADANGICYLRNVEDADNLIDQMKNLEASKEKDCIVIGGGYIGMECAAALSLNGMNVTMIFPEKNFMERLFPPTIAEYYEDYYKQKGIKIVKGNLVTGFTVDDNHHVTGVTLKSGESLPCGLAVAGVGAKANYELFDGQLDIEAGGIKVDGFMKTSHSDVYAVGDVAAFPLLMNGGSIQRQEHVMNCRLSAAHAVQCMLSPSTSTEYDYLPYFYSRVFSLSWVFYGFNKGEMNEFGDKSTGKFGAYWVSDSKVVGVFLEGGTPEEVAKAKDIAKMQPAATKNMSLL